MNKFFRRELSVSLLIFPAIILPMILFNSCKQQIKEEIEDPDNKVKNIDKVDRDKDIPFKYKKEGFISKNIFRIVIVEPKESCPEIHDIEKTAKRRALMSLQKHLSSRNRIINQNTRTKLLNLINQNGKLTPLDEDNKTRKVFIFDVKKNNLKQYLAKAAPRRM